MTVIYDRFLTEREIAKSGVNWFKFDEASGNVTDSKGTAIGTVSSGITRVQGLSGNAVKFNGTDSTIVFNQKLPLGKKSVRFKVKASKNGKSQGIMATYMSGVTNSNGHYVLINPQGILRWINYSGNLVLRFEVTSVTDVADGNWHDVLFTWTGTNAVDGAKLYIDGVLESEKTSPSNETVVDYINIHLGRVGSTDSAYWNPFAGELDEFEVYNDIIDLSPINKSFIQNGIDYKKFVVGVASVDRTFPNYAITKNDNSEITITCSYERTANGNYAYNVFSKSTSAWYCGVAPTESSHWIKFDVKSNEILSAIDLSAPLQTGSIYALKSWSIYGSVDDVNYTLIYSGSHPNNAVVSNYHFPNNSTPYRYYKISNLTSHSDSVNTVGINEVLFYFKGQPATPPYWTTVSSTLPTLTQFQTEGMDDLTILDRKVQKVMGSPKAMTSEVLGVGKVYKASVDLNKIFDLRKLEVK